MRYKATAQFFGILKTLSDTTLFGNGCKKLIVLEKMAAIWMVNCLTWPIISQQMFARTALHTLLCFLRSAYSVRLAPFVPLRFALLFLLCSVSSTLPALLRLLAFNYSAPQNSASEASEAE